MLIDLDTVRRKERRDGIPCFTLHEPKPSTVAHLFHPCHPDYEAARDVYESTLPRALPAPAPEAITDQFWADRHRPDPA